MADENMIDPVVMEGGEATHAVAEKEARMFGWRPADEYEGPAERWKPAEDLKFTSGGCRHIKPGWYHPKAQVVYRLYDARQVPLEAERHLRALDAIIRKLGEERRQYLVDHFREWPLPEKVRP